MNLQNPDIRQEHIEQVLSTAASITNDLQAYRPADFSPDENDSQIHPFATQWLHHLYPKIIAEIPQSLTDFLEQFQLTIHNLNQIVWSIDRTPDQQPTEAQHFAISDTLYDTLVQTGMHQKTITDLLQLIEKYVNTIPEDPANAVLLNHIQELQTPLRTLCNGWNLTKLKFSTIIADIDAATGGYTEYLDALKLPLVLDEWKRLIVALRQLTMDS